jgi:integrase
MMVTDYICAFDLMDTKKTTLGTYPNLTLKSARIQAAIERGNDEKRAEQPAILEMAPDSFGELLDEYYDEHIEPSYRRPRQVRLYIDNRVPDEIKDLAVSNLDELQTREFRVTVRTWLKQYAKARGPVGANRLMAIFKQATRYGTAIGYITVDPLQELTRKLVGGEERARDRVLTDYEIKLLWATESDHMPLLRFLLLTGQRIGEAQKALWTDIDGDKWHIPAENSKNKKPHWVPITSEVQFILDSQDKRQRRIFKILSATGTQAWLRRWCDRNGITDRFTPHDLRRTFETGLNELGVEPYIVERMTNHSLQGTMAVYNRAEYEQQRFDAAKIWSKHIHELVEVS